jgi:hypothetical protein
MGETKVKKFSTLCFRLVFSSEAIEGNIHIIFQPLFQCIPSRISQDEPLLIVKQARRKIEHTEGIMTVSSSMHDFLFILKEQSGVARAIGKSILSQ